MKKTAQQKKFQKQMLTLNRTPLNQMEDTCNQTQARLFEFLFWLGSLSRLAIMTVHLFFEIMQLQVDYEMASRRVCLGAPGCGPRVGG